MGHWFESSVAQVRTSGYGSPFFLFKSLWIKDLERFGQVLSDCFGYPSCGGREAENTFCNKCCKKGVSKCVSAFFDKGCFMQPFYLSKGKQGYYRVYFVNQATGAVLAAKSTQSKNKMEAAVIASEWLKNGIPGGYTNTRKVDSGLNVSKIASLLSRDEAAELIKILNTKFSNNSPVRCPFQLLGF